MLRGVDLAEPDDAVTCTVQASGRAGAVPGVVLTRRALTPAEITVRGGPRVTVPLRTAVDVSRARPIEDAVADLDRLVPAGLGDVVAVRAAAATLPGRDCRYVRRVAALADGPAESPQVTRSSLGSTPPGPSTDSPSSTTAPGTATRPGSAPTVSASTV